LTFNDFISITVVDKENAPREMYQKWNYKQRISEPWKYKTDEM